MNSVKIADKALVVFSGGQDSTTCLHWAINRFTEVKAIGFDYGQRHRRELDCAREISFKLGIEFSVFHLNFFKEMGGNALTDASQTIKAADESNALPNTFVPGRNVLFLSCAASFAYTLNVSDLVCGVCQTDYSGYPDCRNETIQSLTQTLNFALGLQAADAEKNLESIRSCPGESKKRGPLKIHTPLMYLSKAESVQLAIQEGAMNSLALSHTCYAGTFPPCASCPACILRAKGFSEAGIPDPLLQKVLPT